MPEIVKVGPEMAGTVWRIQQAAFLPLLEKYQDYDLSPAMESVERVRGKMECAGMDTYLFLLEGETVGSVRTSLRDGARKISALCVLPEHQGKGIAQVAMRRLEEIYPEKKWVLATIKQEVGNCHLYEKLGYRRVGGEEIVNERMTLVFYEKNIE